MADDITRDPAAMTAPQTISREALAAAVARAVPLPSSRTYYEEGWIDCLTRVRDLIAAAPAASSGLDPERLARAMNAFEKRADVSGFVETNLGTHRADCIHVAWVAREYDRETP